MPRLLLGCILGTSMSGFAQTIPAAAETSPPAPEQIADCSKVAREMMFHDLAGFARYGSANATLQPSGPGVRRVVFMGDSITDSWASVDPRFFARSDFIDRGISGQTTLQMLLRFRQDVIALKPAVVHIMAGTNDIAGNTGPFDLPATEANIASMVDLARANGIEVVIGSVLPAKDFSWHPGIDPGPKIVALNKWLKKFSHAGHLIYVDYYTALTDGALGLRPDLSPDGVHPSLAAYLIMDPLAYAAIREAKRRQARSH
ncbi:MAG: GDSL-type esterase/lipase family protein [Pseudomonadota bacterium]|nr:GDSL-type esterase/lipase family protein [Pseudomonadota bacterium]